MLNKKFLFYKLNIVFSVAVLSLIVISLNAYASGKEKVNSANAKVVVATAKTPPMNDGLPLPGFEIDPERTALVITDPQNDFLSPKGVAWGVVGKNVTENGVVKHLEDLFKVADKTGLPVFISPHYYFPYDNRWKFEGTLEKLMHGIHMFERAGSLDLTNFDKSGADWLEQYKPYINNGKTVVTSPHKVYGPETNDLVLQLRKAGIDKIILAGMSANLCTESHMRELIEQGFEVMVVTDATGAAVTEHYDGYAAALTNFRFIASNIDNTENTVKMIEAAYGK
jgi:nicotinamidase-related amidase